jgi:hypothetical protein
MPSYRARYHQKPYPGFYEGATLSIDFDADGDEEAREDCEKYFERLAESGVRVTRLPVLRIDVKEETTQIWSPEPTEVKGGGDGADVLDHVSSVEVLQC